MSAVERSAGAGILASVAVSGMPGLPALDLRLEPLTALIGPRGAGKSQLLGAIAWLIAAEPPFSGAIPPPSVSGRLSLAEGPVAIRRGPHGFDGPAETTLPALTFLRARDRLSPVAASRGVGARLAVAAGTPTSDAVAAEALVSVIDDCCLTGWSGEILLVEEPEMQLTPQAQRYLYRLLRRFAEMGNQVVYSTRSPAFLDAARHQEIVRLDLHARQPAIHQTDPATLSDEERVRLAAEFDHERSEMFFADVVVLVEGQTERLALPFVFRAFGHEIRMPRESRSSRSAASRTCRLPHRCCVSSRFPSSSSMTPIVARTPRPTGGSRPPRGTCRSSGSSQTSRRRRDCRRTATKCFRRGSDSRGTDPFRPPSRGS